MSKYRKSPLNKLIMTEFSRILRNIFFPKILPILKLEVVFFSAKRLKLKIKKKTDNLFGSVGRAGGRSGGTLAHGFNTERARLAPASAQNVLD